ncbi:Acyltransferase-like protein, chloroplastic [Melia azedarach]|uniref:Acyltransferase-like protein, chloroplastic n=1 Tax=Melia azedarach TaxID=155640 RepID=A0ACC1XG85_MELAZ|nr:Acyltransferase-like protein, chloroplastic [Melia azedarach]
MFNGVQDYSQHIAKMIKVLTDILLKKTFLWKQELHKSASAYANARLHTWKGSTAAMSGGSQRLSCALPICQTHCFENNGHFLFLIG